MNLLVRQPAVILSARFGQASDFARPRLVWLYDVEHILPEGLYFSAWL